MQRGPAVVIADVGAVCADVCPAHAHADTLSCELSVDGRRLLVNTGVSQYGQGPERDAQRGTAAHNTVTVDGRNSSDVWRGFRVGRRARVHGVAVQDAGGVLELRAAHDGYRMLAGRPVHERVWRLDERGLVIVDRVGGGAPAIAHYHFAPGTVDEAQLKAAADAGAVPALGGGALIDFGPGARAANFDWCPEFGRMVPSVRVNVPLRDGQCTVRVSWPDRAVQ